MGVRKGKDVTKAKGDMKAKDIIKIRAPGKLFLLGEYIVLYGGPAVLISVDRYVNVTLEHSSAEFRIRSRGISLPELHGRWQHNTLKWTGVTPAHDLITHVVARLCQDGVVHENTPPFDICIDSSELFEQGEKLGLGSSAAVTHALARAIVDFANATEPTDIPPHGINSDWVFNVHRSYQQGKGSGADVAAGVVGGAYVFTRLSDHWLPHIEAIELPSNLHCRYIWVGKAASTQAALNRLQQYQRQRPVDFTHSVTPLMTLATEGIDALQRNDAAAFSLVCDRYCHNLSDFGRTVGIDVVSQEHAEVHELARSFGVAYKPSGAGSGDFGVAFSTDINQLQKFERKISETQYRSISLSLGQPCHRVE